MLSQPIQNEQRFSYSLCCCMLTIMAVICHVLNTTETSDRDIVGNFWQLRRNDFGQIDVFLFDKMNVSATAGRVTKWHKFTCVKAVQWLHIQLSPQFTNANCDDNLLNFKQSISR